MAITDALTEKRRDVRHHQDELTRLEAERDALTPGPGYYDARQALTAKIEKARLTHERAYRELLTLQDQDRQQKTGTQGQLL
jgi:hypothetical protein